MFVRLSARPSVCLSVTLISHVQKIQDIEILFALYDGGTKFYDNEFIGSPRMSALNTDTPYGQRKFDKR